VVDDAAEGCADGMHLSVHNLSGNGCAVRLNTSTTPQELCRTIEKLIGIPHGSQQWLVAGSEVLYENGSTLAELGLKNGDQLTVMHSGFAPLASLPLFFALELTSARERFSSGYSSGFTIVYKCRASLVNRWLYFEAWRKNNHDKFLFDVKEDVRKDVTSHWMAGSSSHSHGLDGRDCLQELCDSWKSTSTRVESMDYFWLDAVDAEALSRNNNGNWRNDDDEKRPSYHRVPGWFVKPKNECRELKVDIPLPSGSKRIIRLLIDRQGQPLRAAIKGCKMGQLHQDIEEFDVNLEMCNEPLAKPL
jgi:hypothetical protein